MAVKNNVLFAAAAICGLFSGPVIGQTPLVVTWPLAPATMTTLDLFDLSDDDVRKFKVLAKYTYEVDGVLVSRLNPDVVKERLESRRRRGVAFDDCTLKTVTPASEQSSFGGGGTM